MYTLKIIAVPFPKHYYVQSKEIAFLTTIRLPRCDMLKHLLQKRGSGIYVLTYILCILKLFKTQYEIYAVYWLGVQLYICITYCNLHEYWQYFPLNQRF